MAASDGEGILDKSEITEGSSMQILDEKDYIIRMIKQIARMILALLGKEYSPVNPHSKKNILYQVRKHMNTLQ